MGEQQRKAAKAKPISSNPLFPAVVALWFGALFGLGSLAVRPALLEGLVLKFHLDLILPAAAPPLGITARILIALVLAAIGAVAGILLTRRLTRPAPVEHERKRGAKDLAAAPVRVRSRDAHPDAPARRPISAHEELGAGDPPPVAEGPMANRRRALAIVHAEEDYVPHNMAPVPGANAEQPLAPVVAAELYAPLATAQDPVTEPAAMFVPPAGAPQLDWTSSAPAEAPFAVAASPSVMPATIAAQRPTCQAPEPVPAESSAIFDASLAPEHNRQIFGQTPPAAAINTPRQIFGISAEGDHVPQEFVKAAGFQTSVFDTPEAVPLFGAPAGEVPPAPTAVSPELPPFTAAAPALVAPAMPAPEPLPSPASLGMTDLAARLAESMRRRRAARAVEPAAAAATPAALPSELREDLVALVRPEPPLAQIETPLAQVQTPLAQFDTPLAMPSVFASAPQPAPSVAAAPLAATEPAPEPALARFAAPTIAAAPAAAANTNLPAAMRPLALDHVAEDHLALDTSFLPPRHLAEAPAATPTPFAANEAPLELTAEAALADFDETGGEAPMADEHYGSLLGIPPPRQMFARIDEPAPVNDTIEPVVIFPGQAACGTSPFDAPGPSALAVAPSADGSFRRFDAPASASQGQPIAANMSASTVDPAEADRALRAALANLQRMSGAA